MHVRLKHLLFMTHTTFFTPCTILPVSRSPEVYDNGINHIVPTLIFMTAEVRDCFSKVCKMENDGTLHYQKQYVENMKGQVLVHLFPPSIVS